jgi:hypothetical protein
MTPPAVGDGQADQRDGEILELKIQCPDHRHPILDHLTLAA